MQIEQHKQYSQLDEFRIVKDLGSGLQATVKLGEDANGVKVAIKKYKTQRVKLEALENETKIIKQFNHENIIRLIDCRPEAKYTKKDGTQYTCAVIVFEYAGGGQLFDYIADSGRFSEKVTRSYFGQLMNGLHHMHSKGFVHRDLKPENLLLSEEFMLKIGDFGFSCHKMKHDGILQSRLGTHGYMAPQIYEKKYDGEKTDVFAAGVILFVMFVGGSPFNKATQKDTFYSFIINKQYDKFWKQFQKRRGKNFFDPKFKDLVQKMLASDPKQRISIVEIAQHPWINGPIPTVEELNKEFDDRKKKVAAAIEKRRLDEEKKKLEAKEHMKMEEGNLRGSQATEIDNFVEELRAEEHLGRKVPVIEEIDCDDWIIEEQLPYVIVRLKQYLTKLQLNLYTDPLDQQITHSNKSQLLHLQTLQDTKQHKILAQFQFEKTFESQDEEATEMERIVIGFSFGRDGKGNTVLRCVEEEGDWFYCRRVVREVRRLFVNKIGVGK